MDSIKSAAGYIRVSTAEQSLKGLSIETQIAEIENYAKAQNMKLVGVYIDRGITARKQLARRVEFMRLMEDVAQGKVNHIIVLRLDRFFRNIYDYHRMMNEYLIPNHCDWSAVKEQYSTATTNGRLMINLRLAIAEQECDTDSDRIKDVQRHRVSEGYIISGAKASLGLKIENKRIVKSEENHIAKEIYDYFEKHGSVRGTMRYINQKYGLKLRYIRVKRILENPFYKGQYRDNVNFCEPTVTVEQWDRVQLLMKKNIKERSTPQIYLFTGILKCAKCGHVISGSCSEKGGKLYKYYRCSLRVRDNNCDNLENVSEQFLEQHLLDNIGWYAEQEIYKLELEEKKKKTTKNNRKQIEAKLKRLNDLYVDGFIKYEQYKEDYEKLQEQIVELEETAKADPSSLLELTDKNFKEWYTMLTMEKKRAFWRGRITEIRMDGKEVKSLKLFVRKKPE